MLYPTELLRHLLVLFNFHCSKESNNLPLRRRVLYPAELLRQVTVAIIPVFRPDCKCPLQFCARFLILQDGHEPLHGLRLPHLARRIGT